MTIKRKVKYLILEIYWNIRGRFFKNPLLPDKLPESILFICQGNIIRSVFAEKAAPLIAQKYGLNSMRFHSSGVAVKSGTPSPKLAVEVAHDFKISIEDHRSRQLTSELCTDFDLIIAMEVWHIQQLKKMVPESANKIYLLPLFQKKSPAIRKNYHGYNIPDPYGKNREQFAFAFTMIQLCLESFFEQLKKPSL